MRIQTSTVLVLVALSTGISLGQGPILNALLPQYESAKLNFTEAAEFMPEGDYTFKLSPAQRAYGQWIDHTVGMNLRLCSTMKGETAPPAAVADQSKAALVKALKESFDYCDGAWKSMTEDTVIKEVAAGSRKVTPLSMMVTQVVQLNEHYGNMVGYLRTKGIVPPTTARAAKKK